MIRRKNYSLLYIDTAVRNYILLYIYIVMLQLYFYYYEIGGYHTVKEMAVICMVAL